MKLLVLGGTGETRAIAKTCLDLGHEVIASLAGATRSPKPLGVPTRVGGFGGAGLFKDYLADEGIEAIVDATHPFAAQITKRSYEVATDVGVPMLRFERPAWTPGVGDMWTEITDEREAKTHVRPGDRVFLATGRQTLARFDNLQDAYLICRQIDPPDQPFPFPNGEYRVGRPPFSKESEVTLFRELRIDVLVVKNAGGAASRTKLDAARDLGIPVLMIARPKPSGVTTVSEVEEIYSWLEAQS